MGEILGQVIRPPRIGDIDGQCVLKEVFASRLFSAV
jgi:hypothetical protein